MKHWNEGGLKVLHFPGYLFPHWKISQLHSWSLSLSFPPLGRMIDELGRRNWVPRSVLSSVFGWDRGDTVTRLSSPSRPPRLIHTTVSGLPWSLSWGLIAPNHYLCHRLLTRQISGHKPQGLGTRKIDSASWEEWEGHTAESAESEARRWAVLTQVRLAWRQFSDWLASSWNFEYHQHSDFNQSRVYVLVVSSFHLERGLLPVKTT
mgnify:CR=1 FL=1